MKKFKPLSLLFDKMDYQKELFKGVSRNILLLGIASLLNDMSSEMIMPILPLFIVSLGGGEVVIGLISGTMESISSFFKVIFGYLSDRIGKRRRFVFYGYSISALFKLLLGFSTVWEHILIFSGLERTGKGIRTAPRDAIISESMPDSKGKGFGIHRSMDTFGAVIGASFAFIFIWIFGLDYRTIIVIAALISFMALTPLIWVKEKKIKMNKKFKIGFKNLSSTLKMFIAIATIFSMANISYMFFLIRAQTLFGNHSVAMPVLLYVLFNIFYAIFAIPFGSMSDKIGRKKILILGYALFSMICIGFAITNSIISSVFLFALYGVVYAIVDGNQRAFASDLSSKRIRATALGTFHTVIGLVALPTGIIAGYLWEGISFQATFIYAGVLSAIAAVMFLTFIKDSGKS